VFTWKYRSDFDEIMALSLVFYHPYLSQHFVQETF